MTYFLSAIAGYLIGSISSAVIVSRLMGLPDPRQEGSGNPGATNVLRLGNKLAAALTLIGDILKGAIPVLIAASLTAEPMAIALAGAGSFFGHLFPVFFGFKGGKGVATALGVFLAINPFIALSLALTWLTIAIIFRFSSLAAIISSASAPLWAWWFDSSDVYIVLAFALAIILVWRHSENIKRLIAGTESKIGKKS
ncbi:MAG: glycerol-3-phosphate 1-O-acyltransferase PlsY [Proteobacteria bacterium]|nr:glycerol-3-phosphate 1-O-acyltransferase PlsY [Pseudomonadota bacterium]MBT4107153.1 glycerol-3-phosphate 1-O-acyltransferase PlsY [Pseudomonadota bacterium]MBT6065261.1 glycerol-3-phosphate 1-O-acyltransferase PlsY [Pseudomonadota bacterium]